MSTIRTSLHSGSHLYVEGSFLRCLSRIASGGSDATIVLQHMPLDGRRSGKVLVATLEDLVRLERAGLAALIRIGPSSPALVQLPEDRPTGGRSCVDPVA